MNDLNCRRKFRLYQEDNGGVKKFFEQRNLGGQRN